MKGDSLVVVEHNTLNFARTPSFAHPNLAAPVTHPFSALSSARAPRCACLPASVNGEASRRRRPRGGEVLCGSSSSKGG